MWIDQANSHDNKLNGVVGLGDLATLLEIYQ